MAFIETINLGQKREGRDILKRVNLKIKRGETLALIGPHRRRQNDAFTPDRPAG